MAALRLAGGWLALISVELERAKKKFQCQISPSERKTEAEGVSTCLTTSLQRDGRDAKRNLSMISPYTIFYIKYLLFFKYLIVIRIISN